MSSGGRGRTVGTAVAFGAEVARVAVFVATGLIAVGLMVSACSEESPGRARARDRVVPITTTSVGAVPSTAHAVDPGAGESTAPAPPTSEVVASTTTTAAPFATTTTEGARRVGAVNVVEVIDGDTIRVAGGHKVRLIGIDTPERGQCGYTEAAIGLSWLIGGRPVVLVPGARTDTDRYGRLLRYVEVDGVDLNLAMIRSGRAIARYDSRDGYGRHPREDSYVAADAASPDANTCAGSSGTVATTRPTVGFVGPLGGSPGSAAGSTDPRFGTCREAKARGYGPYTQGVDPEYDWYRDGDRDGVVCE